jgi:hypothetical protein
MAERLVDNLPNAAMECIKWRIDRVMRRQLSIGRGLYRSDGGLAAPCAAKAPYAPQRCMEWRIGDRGGSPPCVGPVDRGGSPPCVGPVDRDGSPPCVGPVDRGGSPPCVGPSTAAVPRHASGPSTATVPRHASGPSTAAVPHGAPGDVLIFGRAEDLTTHLHHLLRSPFLQNTGATGRQACQWPWSGSFRCCS